jgi:penicillin-binding protein 2
MASDKRSSRLGVLGLVMMILFGLLGTRMWFLQVRDAPALEERVQANKTRTVPLLPERGRIFDRDGRIVADNSRILVVTVDRLVIRDDEDRAVLFERLSGALGVPVSEFEERYESVQYSPLLPVPLAEGVSEPQAMFITERIEDYPGVQIELGWKREYPFAPLASHIIGYTSLIFAEEADEFIERGYNLNERVGRFGVEHSYETVLRGTPGKITYEVDARGQVVDVVERVEPIPGSDLLLTVDLDLQQVAEEVLETQLKLRRTEIVDQLRDADGDPIFPDLPEFQNLSAPAGSVVVMNHDNGEVVAMASYPTFDNRWFNAELPNGKFQEIFPAYETDPRTGEILIDPETGDKVELNPDKSILVNRAIQGQYNVGSTFKPFVAYAALETNLLPGGAAYTYDDEGTYKLFSIDQWTCDQGVKCEFRNAISRGTGRPSVYGAVNVEDALSVSVDTFFYKIGEEIFELNDRRPVLQNQVRKFSFGADTGIDLPFEFDGRVPDKDVKARLYDDKVLHPSESRNYLTGDNVQLSIGQGLLAATPIQLATAYGTIANGGKVHRPKVVAAILAPGTDNAATAGFADLTSSKVLEAFVGEKPIRKVHMPPAIRDPIVRGLTRVVTPGGGKQNVIYHTATGERLFRDYPAADLPIAGKTGTAQGAASLPWNDSSVFAAFSLDPAKPYTVAAYLEKSGYGSQAAGPVTKCMYLALQGKLALNPVELADDLDLNATSAAPDNLMADARCLTPALVIGGPTE